MLSHSQGKILNEALGVGAQLLRGGNAIAQGKLIEYLPDEDQFFHCLYERVTTFTRESLRGQFGDET